MTSLPHSKKLGGGFYFGWPLTFLSGQNFNYTTAAQICQAENRCNFAQIFLPKFVHFAYCIFYWFSVY